MKTANISQLKARLSSYLEEVRRGGTIVVCDRKTPVARLVPYAEDRDTFRVEPATRPVRDLKKLRGVKPRHPVNIDRLLQESREDR